MGHMTELTAFLDHHRDQLVSSGVPEKYWPTIYHKLLNQVFDAGTVFEILRTDESREEHEPIWILTVMKDMELTDPGNIFLVDHFWAYLLSQMKDMLYSQYNQLAGRLCNILGLDGNLPQEDMIPIITDRLWKINNFYSYSNGNAESPDYAEKNLPVWYVMDELGCSVIHSNSPNVRIVPFIYCNQETYSLMFPIRDIEENEIIKRDYVEGITDPERRKALLLPWEPQSFENYSIVPPIPDEKYFISGHILETLPTMVSKPNTHKSKFKVFSQYSLIKKYLTDEQFTITEEENEADILWYTEHFIDFKKLSETPDKFVNQFPFEYVLTVKDLLSIICRRKPNALWYPITYNLITELPNFVSCFQKRDKASSDNFWIVKPFNLARGLDIHITNNLDYILKVSTTCPKIAQKYISNPVLFYRPECEGKVKFDVRYVVLVKSVKPIKAFVHKKFFLRFANQKFEMKDFDVYEKHFTVMNYTETAVLKHIKCEDFLLLWEQQYPDNSWKKIEESILRMLREILECAVMMKPPCGIAESPQSRALYAADIMLEWTQDKEIQPKILEMNYTPDCQRACDYYPNFYNDIFKLLFLDENNGEFLDIMS